MLCLKQSILRALITCMGYAVECALKACIAKQTNRHDFPEKAFARKVYVHDLDDLLKLAGLEAQLDEDMKSNALLEVNWSTVKDWKEDSRYSTSISTNEARDLYSACTSRKNGILNWIKARW